MSGVLVVIPVLGRPANAGPVAISLLDSQVDVPLRPVFVCNVDDTPMIEAALATFSEIMLIPPRAPGDYARKVNAAIANRRFDEPWIFTGADDLRFHQGWADAAIAVAVQAGCSVIGTNDLGNPTVMRGFHSTHSLVSRLYVEQEGTIDEKGKALHEGYDHQYVDTEFVETARARGEFAFAADSKVEHLHPFWKKSETDDVYRLAMAEAHSDRALYLRRRGLWES